MHSHFEYELGGSNNEVISHQRLYVKRAPALAVCPGSAGCSAAVCGRPPGAAVHAAAVGAGCAAAGCAAL